MAKGLYYEDFNVGDVFFTRSRTITEADIVLFTQLSWDTNPLHTDEEYCKAHTSFGERIAHGALGFAAATGLIAQLGHLEGTAIAFVGMQWQFTAPIKAGDTITVQIAVTGKRETSKPDKGILVREITLLNQRKEVVQKGEMTVLVKRRPSSQDE